MTLDTDQAPAAANFNPEATRTLWAIHLQGPDDCAAAPSKAEADAACVLINAAIERRTSVGDTPVAKAVATEWPFTRAEWGESVNEFYQLFSR